MATQNRYMLTPKKILNALIIIFSVVTIPAAMADAKEIALSICKYDTTISASGKRSGSIGGEVKNRYSGVYTFVCDNGIFKHLNWGNKGDYNLKEILKPTSNCTHTPKYEFYSEKLGKKSWQDSGPGTASCRAMKIDEESLKHDFINTYQHHYTLSKPKISQKYPCSCHTETIYKTTRLEDPPPPMKKLTAPLKKLMAPLKKLKRTRAITCPQAIECKSSTERLCTAKDSSSSTAKIAYWHGNQFHKKGTHHLRTVQLFGSRFLSCRYGTSTSAPGYVANYRMEPSNYSIEETLRLNKNFKGKKSKWSTWIECDQAKGADPKTCQVYAVD